MNQNAMATLVEREKAKDYQQKTERIAALALVLRS